MSEKLDKILICPEQADREERLQKLHQRLFEATYFMPGSKQAMELEKIINEVRLGGDKAIAKFTEKFDGVKLSAEQFRIDKQTLKKSRSSIDKELLESIRKSIANVRKYQEEIFIGNKSNFSGKCGIKYSPIKRVGLCVPGASAPLPSTVIMTAVPAQAAGVKEIAVISPPRFEGSIHPVILAACFELGIEEVYRIGGAHAVAALAYGTPTIKRSDKIVGPGNQWVQMAKRAVFGLVDIDSIAGPSEVLIIADAKADAGWVAADMLSQAEHAPGSAVVFTDSQELAKKVISELEKQVQMLDRAEQTKKYLLDFSGIVVFENMEEVVEQANEFASEHLEIQCGDNSRAIAEKIENAGAIFIGGFTPVAVGDYWAGPSHTLPTGMTARFFSALSSNDFVKSTSLIEYDKQSLENSSSDIIRLARTEGLDGHAKSIEIRRHK